MDTRLVLCNLSLVITEILRKNNDLKASNLA